LIALLVASGLACRKASPPPSSPTLTSPRSVEAATVQAKLPPAEPLCRGRTRCSVAERRPATVPDAGTIVIVRIDAPVDAATDEDRCRRREYWLSRPAGELLLALDCEEQWGADNAGPASLRVTDNLATFHYVEFLADDACETVDASIRLPQGRIESHARHVGKVVNEKCRASRKLATPSAPGTGAADDPVLVLHRP
jgi:hypothetical protein